MRAPMCVLCNILRMLDIPTPCVNDRELTVKKGTSAKLLLAPPSVKDFDRLWSSVVGRPQGVALIVHFEKGKLTPTGMAEGSTKTDLAGKKKCVAVVGGGLVRRKSETGIALQIYNVAKFIEVGLRTVCRSGNSCC